MTTLCVCSCFVVCTESSSRLQFPLPPSPQQKVLFFLLFRHFFFCFMLLFGHFFLWVELLKQRVEAFLTSFILSFFIFFVTIF